MRLGFKKFNKGASRLGDRREERRRGAGSVSVSTISNLRFLPAFCFAIEFKYLYATRDRVIAA